MAISAISSSVSIVNGRSSSFFGNPIEFSRLLGGNFGFFFELRRQGHYFFCKYSPNFRRILRNRRQRTTIRRGGRRSKKSGRKRRNFSYWAPSDFNAWPTFRRFLPCLLFCWIHEVPLLTSPFPMLGKQSVKNDQRVSRIASISPELQRGAYFLLMANEQFAFSSINDAMLYHGWFQEIFHRTDPAEIAMRPEAICCWQFIYFDFFSCLNSVPMNKRQIYANIYMHTYIK